MFFFLNIDFIDESIDHVVIKEIHFERNKNLKSICFVFLWT